MGCVEGFLMTPLHAFVEGLGVVASAASSSSCSPIKKKNHPQPLQQGLEGSIRPLN